MDSLPVIYKSYELYKNMIQVNNTLSKRWRYGLGLSAENSILEWIEILVMAKNAPKSLKAGYLIRAVSKVEVTTLKLRLFLELNLVNETRVFQMQSHCAEIGRMVGGWLKATQTQ